MFMHFTRRAALAGLALALGSAAWGARPSSSSVILVLGDSLSAEYGLSRGAGWVALMERKLKAEGVDARVVNASISGETTSGGLTRLPPLLSQHKPTHVLIELGANDALRGLPMNNTRRNLLGMIKASKQAGAQVVLVGMQMPPNFGLRYTKEFSALYAELARQESVPLVPFLLKDVADRPDAREWFQADGIHPLAKAHPVMLGNVWPALRPLL